MIMSDDTLSMHPHTSNNSNTSDTSHKTAIDKMTEEELLQKVLEYKALAQRATADYRNLQRETEQRLKDMRQYASAGVITELCPLVDYFNSAFAAVPEAEQQSSWLQGMRHIQAYLMSILKNHNVELIEQTGIPFDANQHETVGEEASDQPDHSVVKISQPGFTLNGKVIRPAKVIVATDKNSKPKQKNENNVVSVET